MALLENLVLVFVAGLITALATGVGALPFFFFDAISDRGNVVLWGLASGIMVSASVFGLVEEGLAEGTPAQILIGMAAGVLLVVIAHDRLPYGFGFAAGAMIYLVLTEFVPEAPDLGERLPSGGRPELVGGILVGVLVMVPLAFI